MEAELQLRDIHLPEPIGWWPPAPGWWLIGASVLILAVAGLYLWRRFRRRTINKLAMAELRALEAADLPSPEKLRRLSILLRRIGLSVQSRSEVAGLTGEDWLRWLDSPLAQPRFSQGPGRLLLDGPYRPVGDADLGELFGLCREWLERLPGKEREPGGTGR